jgi:hypothetical protein
MVVDLGVAEILEGKVAQRLQHRGGADLPLAELVEELAEASRIHG